MKYRKKSVEVEAIKFTGNKWEALEWWVYGRTFLDYDSLVLIVPTPEGNMMAHVGDWIIKGDKGELAVCKPDIFEATYEEVS
jgi:hypothetical protein